MPSFVFAIGTWSVAFPRCWTRQSSSARDIGGGWVLLLSFLLLQLVGLNPGFWQILGPYWTLPGTGLNGKLLNSYPLQLSNYKFVAAQKVETEGFSPLREPCPCRCRMWAHVRRMMMIPPWGIPCQLKACREPCVCSSPAVGLNRLH